MRGNGSSWVRRAIVSGTPTMCYDSASGGVSPHTPRPASEGGVHCASVSRDRGVSTGGRVRRASVGRAQQPQQGVHRAIACRVRGAGPSRGAQRQRQRRSPAPAVTATPAPVAEYIAVPHVAPAAAVCTAPASMVEASRRNQRRCGVTLSDCCCGSRDVAASHSQTAVAAAGTLRRHTFRLLLRQQGRCGVTLSDCCCGSRDVAASHSQTAVAAAETLRRHTFRLLLRQQRSCGVTLRLLLRQQRRCGVTLAGCCCGSSDVAASGISAEAAVEPASVESGSADSTVVPESS